MLPVYKTCEGLSWVSDVQVEQNRINNGPRVIMFMVLNTGSSGLQ